MQYLCAIWMQHKNKTRYIMMQYTHINLSLYIHIHTHAESSKMQIPEASFFLIHCDSVERE